MFSALGADAIYNLPNVLQRGMMPGELFGTAAPTSGAWRQGAKVQSLYPTPGGQMGWVCVNEGEPGGWRPFGRVEV